MKTSSLIPFVSCLFGSLESLTAEDIPLHIGPVFSSPGLGLKLDSAEIPGDELKFRRVFYVDSKRLPASIGPLDGSGEPAVSAERAIQLITKQDDLTGKAIVTRLEYLVFQSDDYLAIPYYLIEYQSRNSTEYRVVLMDERILKPRLEKQ
ncbi:hypothetical protein ACFQY0_02715 [Haloferula chungangensis]|uniref:Uncharacterized protein n=1 Tax=Haloferula chungangensis TaxID=1048331 RepID=A0ABW2L148_9BACT